VTIKNIPRNIPTPILNSVEDWVASDVLDIGYNKRTTKYSQKFPKKNESKTTTFHTDLFNQQSPKRVLILGVSKKFLPQDGCVMCACFSFLVLSNKVHTQKHPVS